MKHIMLDLETLDVSSSALVLSIGAVAFDPYTPTLGETFYLELTDDLVEQQTHGRTISGKTVQWWMQQSAVAKRVFSEDALVQRVSTEEALKRFSIFVEAHGDQEAEIWGNGADFDNIILGTLYDDFGKKRPWSYSKNRCYRTLKNIPLASRKPKITHSGTEHNALDDAITQAKHLQEIFACLTMQ